MMGENRSFEREGPARYLTWIFPVTSVMKNNKVRHLLQDYRESQCYEKNENQKGAEAKLHKIRGVNGKVLLLLIIMTGRVTKQPNTHTISSTTDMLYSVILTAVHTFFFKKRINKFWPMLVVLKGYFLHNLSLNCSFPSCRLSPQKTANTIINMLVIQLVCCRRLAAS